jgi:hypothetical protein
LGRHCRCLRGRGGLVRLKRFFENVEGVIVMIGRGRGH